MPKKLYPASTWKWYGNAGHLIVGNHCRFHLTTEIGPWLVSTVGEWIPLHEAPNARKEQEYLDKHPLGMEIGCDRLFETMVFRTQGRCRDKACGCGLPNIVPGEVAFAPANDRKTATKNHMLLCEEYARKSLEDV